jgi:hypothetical protein
VPKKAEPLNLEAPGQLARGLDYLALRRGVASYLFLRLTAHAALPKPASIKAIAPANKTKAGHQTVVSGVAPLPPVAGSTAGVTLGGAAVGEAAGATVGVPGATVGVPGATVGVAGATVGVG